MKILKLISTAAATTLLGVAMSTSASAADVVFQNPVSFKGTGCPGFGSVEVVGANTPTLSVLFGGYDAGKDATSGKSRSACSFAIPIKVLRGFQISHITVDWEGYVEGRGELKRKFFLAGNPWKPWQTNNFNKPNGNNFTVRDDLLHASFATGCNGGLYNMRINSQVRSKGGKSYIAVDSADLNNRILFKIKFKKC